MTWQPKRYDPPGREPDDEPDVCSKCEWKPWEFFVWAITVMVVFYGSIALLAVNLHR